MKLFLSILFTTCLLSLCKSQSSYQPAPENLAARKWFDSARFGMFIHWGAFSVPGSGEWVMNDRNITVTEYSSLLNDF